MHCPRRVLAAPQTVVAAFSAFVSPQFAVAFLLSELVDYAVYTPLREKNWLSAVALSNTVGRALETAPDEREAEVDGLPSP